MIPFTLLQKSGPEQRGGRGPWFVWWWKLGKVVRNNCPGRGCLAASFLAIPAVSTVSSTEPTVIIETLVSQRTFLRDLLHTPCDTFPPAEKLTNENSGNAANSSKSSWVRFLHASTMLTAWQFLIIQLTVNFRFATIIGISALQSNSCITSRKNAAIVT